MSEEEKIDLPETIEGEEEADTIVDMESLKAQNGSKELEPKFGSDRWKEYVMSKFRDDELIDGLPTCDGCRRIVEELIGPILTSRVVSVTPPSIQNNGTSTVAVSIEVKVTNESHPAYDEVVYIEDIADVNRENTASPYHLHPSATASTRAEGRALRKILRLSNICTAEEKTKDAVAEDGMDWTIDEPITDSQVTCIDMMCKRLNMSVMDFVSCGRKVYTNIYEVTKSTAAKMIQELNKVQQDIRLKPKSVGEYVEGWKKLA